MEVNVILFDDFETLDAFGPADIFGRIPEHFHVNYLSVDGKLVNSMQGIKVWTDTLEPENISGIVIVPGGKGARRIMFQDEAAIQQMKQAAAAAEYCLMVANGTFIMMQTGVLFRRNIAECNTDKNWKRMFAAGVSFVKDAQWVADGKFYSSAGTMSGLDMTFGVVADLLDIDAAVRVAQEMGYEWNSENKDVYQ